MNMQAKKLSPTAIIPSYKRPGDAGLDIHADETLTIQPKQKAIVKTGVAIALPEHTVGLVWDRSGLAANHALHCLAGVIDCTYRGELKIVLFNLSDVPYTINHGDRIAQLLVQPINTVTITEVEQLDDTVRGEKGFGSSGK